MNFRFEVKVDVAVSSTPLIDQLLVSVDISLRLEGHLTELLLILAHDSILFPIGTRLFLVWMQENLDDVNVTVYIILKDFLSSELSNFSSFVRNFWFKSRILELLLLIHCNYSFLLAQSVDFEKFEVLFEDLILSFLEE